MSFLLFQGSVAVYLLSAAAYLVFFLTQKPAGAPNRPGDFPGSLSAPHRQYHCPRRRNRAHPHHQSSRDGLVFCLVLGCCYLSFRWRYTVKNLGTFVSVLVLVLMLVATFSSRSHRSFAAGSAILVAAGSRLHRLVRRRFSCPFLHRRHHVSAAGAWNQEKAVRVVLFAAAFPGGARQAQSALSERGISLSSPLA